MKTSSQDGAVDLVVRGGRVVTPVGVISGGVAIQGGIIVSIGNEECLPKAKKTIDAHGNYIMPGVIDQEVHIGGSVPLAEDCESESKGAIATGTTTWGVQQTSPRLCPPEKQTGKEYSKPEDLPSIAEAFSYLKETGERHLMTDFFYTPIVLSDQQASEIPDMANKFGVTSYKFYMHMKGGAVRGGAWPIARKYGYIEFDDGMVYRAMENIARLGPPAIICFHCENWEIARLFDERLKRAGRKDMAAWDERSPHFCEAGHVKTYAYYSRVAGCPIFINHVTTQETIEEVLKARAEGTEIFGNTQTCYLSLTHDAWKLNVPLRDRESMEQLWVALRDGVTSCVSSDHVNHRKPREKMEVPGDMWATESGFSSRCESVLPVILSEGVNKGRISLKRAVEVLSENPAKIFGIYPKKGAIMVGSDADLIIVDLELKRTVTKDMIFSSSGWSIYEGWDMTGWPVMTILRGNVLMEWPSDETRARIVSSPIGKYIPRVLRNDLSINGRSVDKVIL